MLDFFREYSICIKVKSIAGLCYVKSGKYDKIGEEKYLHCKYNRIRVYVFYDRKTQPEEIMNNMQQTINTMLKLNNWAVIGAHPDSFKYGNRVFKKLMAEQRKVFLVNPNYDEIDGMRVYSKLEDIADKVDCISMVVNKKIARFAVEAAIRKNIKYIWFQPNTLATKTTQV